MPVSVPIHLKIRAPFSLTTKPCYLLQKCLELSVFVEKKGNHTFSYEWKPIFGFSTLVYYLLSIHVLVPYRFNERISSIFYCLLGLILPTHVCLIHCFPGYCSVIVLFYTTWY